MVLFFIIVCFLSVEGLVSAMTPALSMHTISRNDATLACGVNGFNLLNIFDIKKYYLTNAVFTSMQSGDTAWIGDVASFSKFVVHHGCWALLDNVPGTPYIYNNVFNCALHCNAYFGLRGDTCYCLNNLPVSPLNSVNCDKKCESYFGELCGGTTSMSVYEIVMEQDIGERNSQHEHGQCVIVSKTNDGKIRWATESCTKYCHGCSIICERCKPGNKLTDGRESCYTRTKGNYTWEEAVHECTNIQRARLFNPATVTTPSDISFMNTADRYWTGIFRTFDRKGNVPTQALNTDTCICVRKKNNRQSLLYETLDCSLHRRYFCLDPRTTSPTKSAISTDPSTVSLKSHISSTVSEFEVTTDTAINKSTVNKISGTGTGSQQMPVWAIVALVLALTILLVLIVVLFICKKKISKSTNKDSPGTFEANGNDEQGGSNTGAANVHVSNCSDAIGENVALQYDSIPYDVVDNQYLDIDATALSSTNALAKSKPSPRKPERKSLKAKQGMLVQNEHLTGASSNDSLDNAYNVLNDFRKPTAEGESSNVYDHAVIVSGSHTSEASTDDTEGLYDHTGQPGKSSTRICLDESNLYSSTSDKERIQENDFDVYNHTFDSKGHTRPDSTYNHIPTNNK